MEKYANLNVTLNKGLRPKLEEALPPFSDYSGTLVDEPKRHEYTFKPPLDTGRVLAITKRLIELDAINWEFSKE